MATYYYDKTSPIGTAGFGTLLGGWNDAVWSTSGAGTATSGSTWTALAAGPHTASFGGTSNTATANTVTVTGTISNLAGLIFAASPLLSGNQTVTGGTLNFGSTAGSIVVNGNTPTISSIIDGTNGFTKSGGQFQLNVSSGNTVSGTLNLTGGYIFAGSRAAGGVDSNAFPQIDAFNLTASPVTIYYLNQNTVPGYSFKAGSTFSGGGQIHVTAAQGAGVAVANTINFRNMSGFTGLMILWSDGQALTRDSNISYEQFPTTGDAWYYTTFSANATSVKYFYIPAGAIVGTSGMNIDLVSVPSTATLTLSHDYRLIANQSGGAMTFTGAVSRWDQATFNQALMTFTLDGTNTAANAINGTIYSRASSGALAIQKLGAGRWVLGGTNTYTGGTTISGGFLRATNAQAFGLTGGITLSGGTLELAGVSPANSYANTTGTISVVSGSSTLTQSIVMGGATTFSAEAGAALTLNNTANALAGIAALTLAGAGTVTVNNQITQANSLIKSGAGTARLTNANNSFTAAPSITAGVLEVSSLAAASTNSQLGAGTSVSFSGSGVLRYTGSTGATLSRSVTGSSLSGAGFDNTGSGSLAVTNATMDGTISLASSNSASQFNILTATISSGGFTKTGDGRWISTASNDLAGATTVTTGTLMGANADGATKRLLGGAVTIAAGAKIQLGSDNDQKGRNRYNSLIINGTVGSKSRIRIGGSAVSPTVQMSGNLTISGAVTWDLTADPFKSPGTYRLVEFVSGALVGNIADVSVQLPPGRSVPPGGLVYDGASSPKTITVTVN